VYNINILDKDSAEDKALLKYYSTWSECIKDCNKDEIVRFLEDNGITDTEDKKFPLRITEAVNKRSSAFDQFMTILERSKFGKVAEDIKKKRGK